MREIVERIEFLQRRCMCLVVDSSRLNKPHMKKRYKTLDKNKEGYKLSIYIYSNLYTYIN